LFPKPVLQVSWPTDKNRTLGTHRISFVNLEKILKDEQTASPENNLLDVLTIRLNDLVGRAFYPDLVEEYHLELILRVKVRPKDPNE